LRNKLSIGTVLLVGVLALTGCTTSTRQIDPIKTGSFDIPGTSWKGFCQGNNAFIYVPSKRDSEPDELEAVVYDDFRCVNGGKGVDINPGSEPTPSKSSKPDTDPDGIVDDED
jgi:hypothetical protein